MASLDLIRFRGRLRTEAEVQENITTAVRHAMKLAAERGEEWRGEQDSVKNKRARRKRRIVA